MPFFAELSIFGHEPAAHLCPGHGTGCFTKLGGTSGVHARCVEGARRAREDYNAIERDLDAGESFVISAYADHHPAGMVGVTFHGWVGQTCRLVLEAEHSPARSARSDYPQAQPWTPRP